MARTVQRKSKASIDDTAFHGGAPPWLASLIDAIRDTAAIPPACRLLSREQTATALGVSVRMLDKLSATDDGPPSFMVGGRRMHAAAAVEKWIEERSR